VCAHGIWGPNISKAVEDIDSVPMGHQWEMAYGGSIGHVADDVIDIFGANDLENG